MDTGMLYSTNYGTYPKGLPIVKIKATMTDITTSSEDCGRPIQALSNLESNAKKEAYSRSPTDGY